MSRNRTSDGASHLGDSIAEAFSNGIMRGVMAIAEWPVTYWMRPYFRYNRGRSVRRWIAGFTSAVGVAGLICIAFLGGQLLGGLGVPPGQESVSIPALLEAAKEQPSRVFILLPTVLALMGVCLAIIFSGPKRLLDGQPEEDRRINQAIRCAVCGDRSLVQPLERELGRRVGPEDMLTVASYQFRVGDHIADRVLGTARGEPLNRIIDLAVTGKADELKKLIDAQASAATQSDWIKDACEAAVREARTWL